MRQCKDCKQEKCLNEFASAGVVNGIQYYRYRCIKCYSKFKKRGQPAFKEWYLGFKKALCCKHCGNSDFRVLEFHHVDEETKLFNIADMLNKHYSKSTFFRELAKCEVLCANCHRIETYENRLRKKEKESGTDQEKS